MAKKRIGRGNEKSYGKEESAFKKLEKIAEWIDKSRKIEHNVVEIHRHCHYVQRLL